MRRAYHKWSQESLGSNSVPPPWGAFIEKLLNVIWEEEEKEDAAMEAGDQEMEEADEQGEGDPEDPYPALPNYKDGMLSEKWWCENYSMFKRCQECGDWRYIQQKSSLRHRYARGCAGEAEKMEPFFC